MATSHNLNDFIELASSSCSFDVHSFFQPTFDHVAFITDFLQSSSDTSTTLPCSPSASSSMHSLRSHLQHFNYLLKYWLLACLNSSFSHFAELSSSTQSFMKHLRPLTRSIQSLHTRIQYCLQYTSQVLETPIRLLAQQNKLSHELHNVQLALCQDDLMTALETSSQYFIQSCHALAQTTTTGSFEDQLAELQSTTFSFPLAHISPPVTSFPSSFTRTDATSPLTSEQPQSILQFPIAHCFHQYTSSVTDYLTNSTNNDPPQCGPAIQLFLPTCQDLSIFCTSPQTLLNSYFHPFASRKSNISSFPHLHHLQQRPSTELATLRRALPFASFFKHFASMYPFAVLTAQQDAKIELLQVILSSIAPHGKFKSLHLPDIVSLHTSITTFHYLITTLVSIDHRVIPPPEPSSSSTSTLSSSSLASTSPQLFINRLYIIATIALISILNNVDISSYLPAQSSLSFPSVTSFLASRTALFNMPSHRHIISYLSVLMDIFSLPSCPLLPSSAPLSSSVISSSQSSNPSSASFSESPPALELPPTITPCSYLIDALWYFCAESQLAAVTAGTSATAAPSQPASTAEPKNPSVPHFSLLHESSPTPSLHLVLQTKFPLLSPQAISSALSRLSPPSPSTQSGSSGSSQTSTQPAPAPPTRQSIFSISVFDIHSTTLNHSLPPSQDYYTLVERTVEKCHQSVSNNNPSNTTPTAIQAGSKPSDSSLPTTPQHTLSLAVMPGLFSPTFSLPRFFAPLPFLLNIPPATMFKSSPLYAAVIRRTWRQVSRSIISSQLSAPQPHVSPMSSLVLAHNLHLASLPFPYQQTYHIFNSMCSLMVFLFHIRYEKSLQSDTGLSIPTSLHLSSPTLASVVGSTLSSMHSVGILLLQKLLCSVSQSIVTQYTQLQYMIELLIERSSSSAASSQSSPQQAQQLVLISPFIFETHFLAITARLCLSLLRHWVGYLSNIISYQHSSSAANSNTVSSTPISALSSVSVPSLSFHSPFPYHPLPTFYPLLSALAIPQLDEQLLHTADAQRTRMSTIILTLARRYPHLHATPHSLPKNASKTAPKSFCPHLPLYVPQQRSNQQQQSLRDDGVPFSLPSAPMKLLSSLLSTILHTAMQSALPFTQSPLYIQHIVPSVHHDTIYHDLEHSSTSSDSFPCASHSILNVASHPPSLSSNQASITDQYVALMCSTTHPNASGASSSSSSSSSTSSVTTLHSSPFDFTSSVPSSILNTNISRTLSFSTPLLTILIEIFLSLHGGTTFGPIVSALLSSRLELSASHFLSFLTVLHSSSTTSPFYQLARHIASAQHDLATGLDSFPGDPHNAMLSSFGPMPHLSHAPIQPPTSLSTQASRYTPSATILSQPRLQLATSAGAPNPSLLYTPSAHTDITMHHHPVATTLDIPSSFPATTPPANFSLQFSTAYAQFDSLLNSQYSTATALFPTMIARVVAVNLPQCSAAAKYANSMVLQHVQKSTPSATLSATTTEKILLRANASTDACLATMLNITVPMTSLFVSLGIHHTLVTTIHCLSLQFIHALPPSLGIMHDQQCFDLELPSSTAFVLPSTPSTTMHSDQTSTFVHTTTSDMSIARDSTVVPSIHYQLQAQPKILFPPTTFHLASQFLPISLLFSSVSLASLGSYVAVHLSTMIFQHHGSHYTHLKAQVNAYRKFQQQEQQHQQQQQHAQTYRSNVASAVGGVTGMIIPPSPTAPVPQPLPRLETPHPHLFYEQLTLLHSFLVQQPYNSPLFWNQSTARFLSRRDGKSQSLDLSELEEERGDENNESQQSNRSIATNNQSTHSFNLANLSFSSQNMSIVPEQLGKSRSTTTTASTNLTVNDLYSVFFEWMTTQQSATETAAAVPSQLHIPNAFDPTILQPFTHIPQLTSQHATYSQYHRSPQSSGEVFAGVPAHAHYFSIIPSQLCSHYICPGVITVGSGTVLYKQSDHNAVSHHNEHDGVSIAASAGFTKDTTAAVSTVNSVMSTQQNLLLSCETTPQCAPMSTLLVYSLHAMFIYVWPEITKQLHKWSLFDVYAVFKTQSDADINHLIQTASLATNHRSYVDMYSLSHEVLSSAAPTPASTSASTTPVHVRLSMLAYEWVLSFIKTMLRLLCVELCNMMLLSQALVSPTTTATSHHDDTISFSSETPQIAMTTLMNPLPNVLAHDIRTNIHILSQIYKFWSTFQTEFVLTFSPIEL